MTSEKDQDLADAMMFTERTNHTPLLAKMDQQPRLRVKNSRVKQMKDVYVAEPSSPRSPTDIKRI